MNYLNPCWGETAKAYADCHGFRGFGHYFLDTTECHLGQAGSP